MLGCRLLPVVPVGEEVTVSDVECSAKCTEQLKTDGISAAAAVNAKDHPGVVAGCTKYMVVEQRC